MNESDNPIPLGLAVRGHGEECTIGDMFIVEGACGGDPHVAVNKSSVELGHGVREVKSTSNDCCPCCGFCERSAKALKSTPEAGPGSSKYVDREVNMGFEAIVRKLPRKPDWSVVLLKPKLGAKESPAAVAVFWSSRRSRTDGSNELSEERSSAFVGVKNDCSCRWGC